MRPEKQGTGLIDCRCLHFIERTGGDCQPAPRSVICPVPQPHPCHNGSFLKIVAIQHIRVKSPARCLLRNLIAEKNAFPSFPPGTNAHIEKYVLPGGPACPAHTAHCSRCGNLPHTGNRQPDTCLLVIKLLQPCVFRIPCQSELPDQAMRLAVQGSKQIDHTCIPPRPGGQQAVLFKEFMSPMSE